MLREVSRRTGLRLRPAGALGRYGGQEFLVVLPGCGPSDIVATAKRARDAIAESALATPMGLTPVTASLGVAAGEGRSLDAAGMIRTPDGALYRAKRLGKNRVEEAVDSDAGPLFM